MLDDLIARLEKATGPDRELDGDIAVLFGMPPEDLERQGLGRRWLWLKQVSQDDFDDWVAPEFTGFIDAAVALIGRVLPGHRVAMATEPRPAAIIADRPGDSFHLGDDVDPWGEKAATLPIALCIACLKALRAKQSAEKADG